MRFIRTNTVSVSGLLCRGSWHTIFCFDVMFVYKLSVAGFLMKINLLLPGYLHDFKHLIKFKRSKHIMHTIVKINLMTLIQINLKRPCIFSVINVPLWLTSIAVFYHCRVGWCSTVMVTEKMWLFSCSSLELISVSYYLTSAVYLYSTV